MAKSWTNHREANTNMDPDVQEKIRRYADTAYSSARANIDDEYEIRLANLRENLGHDGLAHSSVADRETSRLYSELVKALVKARADALLEAYETYGALGEEAGCLIVAEVTLLHATLVRRASDPSTDEPQRWISRIYNELEFAPRAQEFSRQVGRLSTPILGTIACEVERRRVKVKEKAEPGGATNVYHVYGNNPRVNVHSTDQSVNVVTTTSEQVFLRLPEEIRSRVPAEQQTEILARLDALEGAQNTPSFAQKYTEFIAMAANHMALVAPFIPALTELLHRALN